jgi:hypothetical protein
VVTEELCSRVTQTDGHQVQSDIKSGGHYLQQSKVLILSKECAQTMFVSIWLSKQRISMVHA